MKVITVSRDYGAGGREVARRLAEALGWELLDRELLHQAAALEHLPDAELERLDEKAIGMADRFRLHPPHERYMHGLTEAARRAAARGYVVLVGRGTRQLLGDVPDAFHLRLEASREWRARRTAQVEGLPWEQATARCVEEDRTRARFMRYFFGEAASQPTQYDLVVNTERVPLDDVVACLVAAVHGDWPAVAGNIPIGRRVLTLTGELGAGDIRLAPTIAERLGLQVYDRELLEREASRLGVSLAEVERFDEQPAGIFQRFRPGSPHQRYFDALGQLMGELADRGDVLLVGRGGYRFLRDHPRAFHVRLMASLASRLRGVMEYRWLAEAPARKLIGQTDARRRQFYETFFGADWSSPLGYHITINTGRLGPAAVDLVAFAAVRHWTRAA
ncbi:MAG: cytidylate kinase-like family protein [Planctomycetaceae bacterium]|nr:cytidylate kinase-like family protein [Planctomycetaceae bacterium]